MENQDWLINESGEAQSYQVQEDTELIADSYRLYRFLTDLEDILKQENSDRRRLKAIMPLVRKLLNNNAWFLTDYDLPDPDLGWSVTTLYDEPDFPLTVQTVAWSPGQISPIHNHGTWGLVALISGQEKNIFWQENHPSGSTLEIEMVGELVISPGDIISFLPHTIHHIEALGEEPTVSFNLYGETDYQKRFEFDPVHFTKTIF